MSTGLRAYIDANESLPPDCVLGNLAWFSVEDRAYDGQVIETLFHQHNLNAAFLPKPLNPADAFEKATTEIDGRKYEVTLPTGDSGTAILLVRQVARTDTVIERHLIREVRDGRNRRLHYNKIGEFVYYRPAADATGRVRPESARSRASLEPTITGPERVFLEGIVAEFGAAFDRYRRFHDGQKMRAIFRNYLLFLNAIQMKPSVYFVHASRQAELASLRQFSQAMDGTTLSLWQLPDLPALRDEVIATFQREGEKEYEEVIKAAANLRSKRGKITPAAFTKIKEQYDDVTLKVGEYTRVLQTTDTRTKAASELARDALRGLQEEVLKGLE